MTEAMPMEVQPGFLREVVMNSTSALATRRRLSDDRAALRKVLAVYAPAVAKDFDGVLERRLPVLDRLGPSGCSVINPLFYAASVPNLPASGHQGHRQ